MNKKELEKINAEIKEVKRQLMKCGCKDVKLINKYARLVDKMIKLGV